MRYIVSRTSFDAKNDYTTKPCEEAYEVDRKVQQVLDDDENIVEEIRIQYEVVILSLEELHAFTVKYGKIVMSGKFLEIYDEWRE